MAKVIYRIERAGRGPYVDMHFDGMFTTSAKPHPTKMHPDYQEDLPDKVLDKWVENERYILVCACISLPALLDWFDGYIDWLIILGFCIVEICVDDYVIGKSGRQGFYRPENVISKFNLTHVCHVE